MQNKVNKHLSSNKFLSRLAFAQMFFMIFSITAAAFLARHYLQKYILNQSQTQLHATLKTIKQSVLSNRQTPLEFCLSINADALTRYILMSWDGTVLCDTQGDHKKQINQSLSPDVVDAKSIGEGTYIFWNGSKVENFSGTIVLTSTTSDNKTQRYILQQSIDVSTINQAITSFDFLLGVIFIPLLIVALTFSVLLGRQISVPLSSLLRKIDNMHRSGVIDSEAIMDQVSEWSLMEHTVETAGRNLEHYVEELFRENQKVRVLLESITDPILAINKGHRLLFANFPFRNHFMAHDTPSDVFSTAPVWEYVFHLNMKDLCAEVFGTERTITKPEIKVKLDSGDSYYYNLTIIPLKNSQKECFGAICVLHNITETRKAQKMKEDFMANFSHEVRTPLTAMKGYAQMLKGLISHENTKSREYLAKIEANSDRLTQLFNDVLNLSKIEAKAEIDYEEISVEELTETVISNIKQNFSETKQLTVTVEYNNLKEISANGLLCEQLLTNLLGNAYKYSSDNGTTKIMWDENEKFYILKVEDSGIGIPKEHIPRLFERFYRVDPSRTREQGGTGLGLAIVKHIIQKHHGYILVDSQVGVGTTFTAFLRKEVRPPPIPETT